MKSPKSKLKRRSFFGFFSDAALRAVGFHDWKGHVGQPIPPHLGVKSIHLLAWLSIPFSYLFFMLMGSFFELLHITLSISYFGFVLFWSFFGVAFTVAQAVRISRLNFLTRQYRLGVLERKVERETTTLPNAVSLSPPITSEPAVNYITQGIS